MNDDVNEVPEVVYGVLKAAEGLHRILAMQAEAVCGRRGRYTTAATRGDEALDSLSHAVECLRALSEQLDQIDDIDRSPVDPRLVVARQSLRDLARALGVNDSTS